LYKALAEKRRQKMAGKEQDTFTDCSFSPDYLLPQVTEDDLKTILKTKEPEEDFEIIDPSPASPFVEAAIKESEVIRTENNAVTFNTSGHPIVDFFFHVMEQTSDDNTLQLLKKSWSSNALNTLKLVANLRDVRGGKSIRYQSITCLYWLYQNHPLTLYNNLENFVKVGYWKDLLHILMTFLFDGFVGPHLKFDDAPDASYSCQDLGDRMKASQKRGQVYNELVAKHFGVKLGSLDHKEMKELRLKYARHKMETDLKYRAFHLKVAQLFADQLLADMKSLREAEEQKEGEKKKTPRLSLVGKWAPSLKHHFDRYSLISTTIAVELVKRGGSETQKEILAKYPAVAACLARKIYHKDYLVPLREACRVPEIYMHPGKWSELDYKRVASKCMTKNKALFLKHDANRFTEFISQSKKVSGATLKPVELIGEVLKLLHPGWQEYNAERNVEVEKEIVEKQWISLSENIKQKGGGLFDSALSICDVSGSMNGTPMNAALGLTLLTTQLSRPPWSSVCVTFSHNPQFHKIDPDHGLFEKVENMTQMNWGMNTDIDAVFQLILTTAEKHGVKSDELPKVLFVFTDMEFDQAVVEGKTNFEVAQQRFAEKGFSLPTVVFWNLRSSGRNSTPIRSHESGSLLISGYSAQLLSFIMRRKDLSELTPIALVKLVIERKMYSNFKVFD